MLNIFIDRNPTHFILKNHLSLQLNIDVCFHRQMVRLDIFIDKNPSLDIFIDKNPIIFIDMNPIRFVYYISSLKKLREIKIRANRCLNYQ